jgi:hypothetical protein
MSKGQRKRKAQERAARISERDKINEALRANDQWYDKQRIKHNRQRAESGPHNPDEFRDALRLSDYVLRVGPHNVSWEVPDNFLGGGVHLERYQRSGNTTYSTGNYSIKLTFERWQDSVEVDFGDLPEGFDISLTTHLRNKYQPGKRFL